MTNPRLAPKQIAPEPEETGARTVTVHIPDVGDVDVVFSEAEAVQLVRMFQQGFLDRIGKRTVHPNYPAFSVVDVDVAHGPTGSGILFQTQEIGSMVALFAPQLAEKIKHEVDRAADANTQRTKDN